MQIMSIPAYFGWVSIKDIIGNIRKNLVYGEIQEVRRESH
jgi:hypothetical protein